MGRKRVIRYRDPLRDDFAPLTIRTRPVDGSFPYEHPSRLWRGAAWLLYYLIAAPVALLVGKVYLGLRFENWEVLKQLPRTGFCLYGNHTRTLDVALPILAAFPRRAYIIANPDAVSIPGLRNLVTMLGAIPVPTGAGGLKQMLDAVSRRLRSGCCVAIFPEAHIWPFYTGIRPFPDTSFRYPVKEHCPAVAMAVTYRKRRGLGRLFPQPAMTVTFSQPMYPRADLPPREAKRELRDRVYRFMAETAAAKENVAYIRYEREQG